VVFCFSDWAAVGGTACDTPLLESACKRCGLSQFIPGYVGEFNVAMFAIYADIRVPSVIAIKGYRANNH
jgi:hypothetical protein